MLSACAAMVVSECHGMELALAFGREQSGLSNEELDLCHYLIYIPSNPVFNSLNLAAAVQLLSYELFVAGEGEYRSQSFDHMVCSEDPVAELESVERLYNHIEETLIALEFLDPANPKHLMRRLRRYRLGSMRPMTGTRCWFSRTSMWRSLILTVRV